MYHYKPLCFFFCVFCVLHQGVSPASLNVLLWLSSCSSPLVCTHLLQLRYSPFSCKHRLTACKASRNICKLMWLPFVCTGGDQRTCLFTAVNCVSPKRKSKKNPLFRAHLLEDLMHIHDHAAVTVEVIAGLVSLLPCVHSMLHICCTGAWVTALRCGVCQRLYVSSRLHSLDWESHYCTLLL